MNHAIVKNNNSVKTKWVRELADNPVQTAMIVLCEAFAFFTLLGLIRHRDFNHIFTCVLTFALILIPSAAERLLSHSFSTAECVFVHFYTVFPMLGECYKLYYTTACWDKIVHTCSGVIFAVFGLYLTKLLCKNKATAVTCAAFALCFSVTISVFWEFAEFAGDQLFGMDTQNDTVITEMNSYLLGSKSDEIGKIEEIYEVTVNGQVLQGYIDIGLIDTMTDMLVETAGALTVAVAFFIQNRKNKTVRSSQVKKIVPKGSRNQYVRT